MDALVSIFQNGRANNSSSYVIFDNANLCGESIILVDVNSMLQYFCLLNNHIDNIDSARRLSRSLKSHSSIIELHLTNCDLGSCQEILLVILHSDVKNIDLSNNNLTHWGRSKLPSILRMIRPFVA
jgi:hypothetical protein